MAIESNQIKYESLKNMDTDLYFANLNHSNQKNLQKISVYKCRKKKFYFIKSAAQLSKNNFANSRRVLGS